MASLFCWQAINHSYYVQQLGMSKIRKCNDTRGVELVRKAIISDWNKYEPILTSYLEKMPMKAFHYVAAYLLKGHAITQQGIAEKYAASSYKTLITTLGSGTLNKQVGVQSSYYRRRKFFQEND